MTPNDRISARFPQLSPLKQALLALEEMQGKLDAAERVRTEPIAVVGMGCRFPGAKDPESYWRLLSDGVDAVVDIPDSRWNAAEYYDRDPDAPSKMATRWAGLLDRVDLFDAEFFGIAPREARSMDPQQRLVLEVAWEAIENAGHSAQALAARRTGIFLGMTGTEYSQLFHRGEDFSEFDAYYASGIARSVAGGRISYVLGLQGPNLVVDTACSSSLVAIHVACLSLRAEECRTALAGGVNVVLSRETTMSFSRSHMLAADGRCKAFDSRADGFVRAEGCGVVVLKRLSDAVADRDRILAVIRGSAINQDGRSGGLTVPSGSAQQAVIREALANAHVSPRQISFVETHGTGTSLGDPIEAHALAAVLGPGRTPEEPLVIGSVKSNIGHLEAAAGVAGLIKTVLCLQHGRIPPNLHFRKMNPHIQWGDVPVEVPVEGRPWQKTADGRRLAGVSAFGFSGTNAHVILEAAPEPTERRAAVERPVHALALSARSDSALRVLAGKFSAELERTAEPLADICYTANAGRAHFDHRLFLITDSIADLRKKLAQEPAGKRIVEREGVRPVFLFSGQGAQYPGMGRELYESQPVFRAALEKCDGLLRPMLEQPLLEVLYGGAGEWLKQTAYTQPALFAIEYALSELWKSWGIQPAAVLGHSVGEYAAACVAGMCSLEEGLELIAERGRRMQALPGAGAMAAVLAGESEVRQALAGWEGQVSIAAVNAPGNVVISGERSAVEAVSQGLRRREIRVQDLTVSHAFHSAQMEPMAEEFARRAAGVEYRTGRAPLISSVTGQAVRAEELREAGYWRRQVREGVQFRLAMEGLGEAGHRVFVEIGPGTTLLGLGRQCLEGKEGVWLPSLRRGESDWRQMLASLGGLYEQGAEVDWAGFDQPYDRRRVSLPTYPFERQRYWLDAQPVKALPAKRAGGGHPLLGLRTEVAGSPGMSIWETDISIEKLPYLADHCVQGSIVVPMAAYLEMIASAALELSRRAACEVTVGEPMLLSPTEPKAVQVVARDGSIEIYSRQADAWRLHATSRAAVAPAAAQPERLDALRRRLRDEFPLHAFQDLLRTRGLDFGPAFQNVRRIWTGTGEALAEVSPSDCLMNQSNYTRAHPALLDGCLQVLAAAIGAADGALYLPVGVESTELTNRLTGELWSHAVIRPEPGPTPGMRLADISIFSPDGALLGQLSGVTLRQAVATVDRLPVSEDGDCLFLPEWKLLPDKLTAAGLSPAEILAGVPSQAESLRSNCRLERHDALEPHLNGLCSAYTCDALAAMGWPLPAGGSTAESALAARCGIVGTQRKLFSRLLAILAEDGILQRSGAEDWLVLRAAPSQDTAVLVAGLRRAYPDCDTELSLTERCGSELAAVLRGRSDPLQLLFPGGSIAELEKLYAGSPSATVINTQVRYAIADAIASLPAGRTLRVLEIGAGTGGTTKAVVPILPADRTEYTFTDISPLFLDRAARTFGAYPAMRYQALDIERDPEEQKFAAGSYDIVLAANVLHATADIRQALDHARRLLAPGGLLFLVEITRPERWIDLTFGMTEGWWRFLDRDLREAYPLLSPAQWRGVLEAGGFDMTAEMGTPGCTSTILVARRALEDAGVSSNSGSWLILADEGGTGAQLAALLEERGKICVTAFARGQMEECFHTPQVWEGVVYLWALNAPETEDLTVESLNRSQNLTCGGLLDLIQRLACAASGHPPRLWLITRGAQQVSGRQDSVAVSQAPLWGMARSIVREHPEFKCVAIDLDPGAGAGSAALLFDEIGRPGKEQHLALRGNSRFSFQLDPPGAEPGTRGPLRISITRRGVLDNLEVQPAHRRRPGPGEVEIAVAAAGLVFRDVLNALDLYPGDPGPLGGECAGKIVSVGAGVDGFREGDEVIAMAPGAHDGFVLADSRLVIRKPASCTFEEAVTLLSSFLTASHALQDLAAVHPGERVLIHAGAGGVGLAAIRIALRAGAEVFATAGSDRKRSYLRSLGVHHLFDSRTLNFSPEILEATGGRGVDVALNSLADDFVGATFSTLAPGGRFIEIGKRGIWTAEQVRALGKDISYHVVDLGATSTAEPERISALLTRIVQAVERGEWTPLPYQSFPFAGAIDAYRFMAQGKHIGKIVLRQEAPEVRILAEATYLVAGGLGGLGVEVARWLVERGARHLVLTARGDCPERARPAIEEMQAAGARIMVRRADVSQREEMANLFAEIARDLPPLRGVIHAAGALADGALLQQSWDRFETVMASKVSGTWILHELTARLPLDFFVLFSSIASVLGAAGQANHAAANAFEDALARDRRLHGLPAVSINWGAWSEVGSATSDDLARRRAAMGIGSFSTARGLALFKHILNAKYPQVAAAQMKRAVVERVAASAGAGAGQSSRPTGLELLQQLESAPEAGRSAILEKYIQGVAKRVLGFPAEREIDPRQPLNELGLDSLMAVEFRNIMAAAMKRPLPATMLFSYPAIEDIARYAAAELFGAPAAAAPVAKPKLLDRIEDLSDAEVDELLAGRIEGRV